MVKVDVSKWNCPACQKPLHSFDPVDIFLEGMICPNQHRYFLQKEMAVGKNTSKALTVSPPACSEIFQIIQNWLSIRSLREKLQDQLAELIRRIYEIEKLGLSVKTNVSRGFKYCLICTLPLVHVDQNDSWATGLECDNGHNFLRRHGITFTFNDATISVFDEMLDIDVVELCLRWLHDKGPGMVSQLHPQIRMVL